MKYFFFTVNSFSTFPIMRYIIRSRNAHVTICHCTIENHTDYFKDIGKNIVLQHFQTHLDYNNKSIYQKFERYFKGLTALIKFVFKNAKTKEPIVFYTIDFFSLWIGLLIKKHLLGEQLFVVYHQFELFDPKHALTFEKVFFSRVGKLVDYLDLVIAPEKNRLDYFIKIARLSENTKKIVIPNSNANEVKPNSRSKKKPGKIIVGHIGAVGFNHCIKEFAEVIKKLSPEKFEFWFVGNLKENVKNLITSINYYNNIKLFDQIPHQELASIYSKIDIGIILYRDLDLNFRYCAPNKLYEYWSYGIPVVAHSLPGLTPIFSEPYQGRLVDMEDIKKFTEIIIKEAHTLNITEKKKLTAYFNDHFHISIFLKKLDESINKATPSL